MFRRTGVNHASMSVSTYAKFKFYNLVTGQITFLLYPAVVSHITNLLTEFFSPKHHVHRSYSRQRQRFQTINHRYCAIQNTNTIPLNSA